MSAPATTTDVIDELQTWLDENWDPDLTVAEWWERLGLAGWSAPSLPPNAYGRGLSRSDANRVSEAIAAHGALAAPGGLGLLLAAPTIAQYGSQEQIDRYVRAIVTGQEAWCQLFSEPVAGSDLAGLQTRAVQDGDEWIVNGQKVWTSSGHYADLGMLIARTNSDAPKHQGISYFALPMHQEGVEIRPLREMTGRSLFNEVFLTDARTTTASLIGELNGGWAVANATLMYERAGLGSGGGSAATSAALPGTVAGHLDQRAGDFVGSARSRQGGAQFRGAGKMLIELAKATGAVTDPTIRQELMKLHTVQEIGRMNTLRAKAGDAIPGLPNIGKLSMSTVMRLQRDIGTRILGAAATLHGYTAEERERVEEATGQPLNALVTELALWAQGPPIYGGTDQVQRNIIGERVLGLPKEPGFDRSTPFSDLPKNA